MIRTLKESCSGLSCPPPEDLPNRGIEPRSPTLQTDSLPSRTLHTHSLQMAWANPWLGNQDSLSPRAQPKKHIERLFYPIPKTKEGIRKDNGEDRWQELRYLRLGQYLRSSMGSRMLCGDEKNQMDH